MAKEQMNIDRRILNREILPSYKFFIGFLPFFLFILSCSAKYVEIENPSTKIELNCYSIVLPEDGEWHKRSYSLDALNDKCENEAKFASGDGDDVYFIGFDSYIGSWNDKLSDKYLFDKIEKELESVQNTTLKDNKFGIEDYRYNLEVVNGIKDICVKSKTDYSSSKPIWLGKGGSSIRFLESTLNPSERYFYEYIEINVIEGPYKSWIGKGAMFYRVIFYHISTSQNSDPELEA